MANPAQAPDMGEENPFIWVPPAIREIPADAPGITEQGEAALLFPFQIPDPQNL